MGIFMMLTVSLERLSKPENSNPLLVLGAVLLFGLRNRTAKGSCGTSKLNAVTPTSVSSLTAVLLLICVSPL